MSDKRPQGGLSQPTGVFVVEREIPELGAQPGDRIILRPRHSERPCCLVRNIGHAAYRLAFTDACRLEFTKPPMMDGLALRLLREGVDGLEPHLTLVP